MHPPLSYESNLAIVSFYFGSDIRYHYYRSYHVSELSAVELSYRIIVSDSKDPFGADGRSDTKLWDHPLLPITMPCQDPKQ